jgi:hypothetical protein
VPIIRVLRDTILGMEHDYRHKDTNIAGFMTTANKNRNRVLSLDVTYDLFRLR